MPNNYAFIDGNNFHKRIADMGWDLSDTRFVEYLKRKFHVTVAYYFMGYIERNEPLYEYLRGCGYTLKFKQAVLASGSYKGNCDVEMTLHALTETGNYDKAIIIANDGDYASLVEHLNDINKLECVVACSRLNFSYLLRKLRHKVNIFYLDDFIHLIKN